MHAEWFEHNSFKLLPGSWKCTLLDESKGFILVWKNKSLIVLCTFLLFNFKIASFVIVSVLICFFFSVIGSVLFRNSDYWRHRLRVQKSLDLRRNFTILWGSFAFLHTPAGDVPLVIFFVQLNRTLWHFKCRARAQVLGLRIHLASEFMHNKTKI